jgi:hypothetical protein
MGASLESENITTPRTKLLQAGPFGSVLIRFSPWSHGDTEQGKCLLSLPVLVSCRVTESQRIFGTLAGKVLPELWFSPCLSDSVVKNQRTLMTHFPFCGAAIIIAIRRNLVQALPEDRPRREGMSCPAGLASVGRRAGPIASV